MSLVSTVDPSESLNQDTTEFFHVGLNVSDLDRSVRFYSALFGQFPAKHFDDYARFEVADPPLVLALYPNPQSPGGPLNHVGLRLCDSVQLVAMQRRLEEAGISTQRQDDVECCYSRQTKFWITDSDRNLWEIYTLHEDLQHSGFDDAPVASELTIPESFWEHRLKEPVPNRLPFNDNSLDEIRLEGTFNASLKPGTVQELLIEANRVLKTAGRIVIHALVGDRPFPGTPHLPGMAAMVERIPVDKEPMDLIRQAGFQDLYFEKLGDIHCFQVDGVELRELRLTATKADNRNSETVAIIYKGPYAEVELDDGLVLRRGEIVTISKPVADRLTSGPAAGQFGRIQVSASGES